MMKITKIPRDSHFRQRTIRHGPQEISLVPTWFESMDGLNNQDLGSESEALLWWPAMEDICVVFVNVVRFFVCSKIVLSSPGFFCRGLVLHCINGR